MEPTTAIRNASTSTERVTCRLLGAEGAQQRGLAHPLGDQDREGVEDDEGADHDRDHREGGEEDGDDVEELADLRPAVSLTTLSPVTAVKPSGATASAAVGQLGLGDAVGRGERDAGEGVLAVEEDLLRLRVSSRTSVAPAVPPPLKSAVPTRVNGALGLRRSARSCVTVSPIS